MDVRHAETRTQAKESRRRLPRRGLLFLFLFSFATRSSSLLFSVTHTQNRRSFPPPPWPHRGPITPPSRRCSLSPSARGRGSQFAERLVLLLRGKRWTLRCFDRWSLRANFFSQTMHWYGFTPEWERRWRDSSSDRENLRGGIRSVRIHPKKMWTPRPHHFSRFSRLVNLMLTEVCACQPTIMNKTWEIKIKINFLQDM